MLAQFGLALTHSWENEMKSFKIAVAVATLSLAVATTATARDRVQLAGSSTVLPYATIIAEAFGENTKFKTH